MKIRGSLIIGVLLVNLTCNLLSSASPPDFDQAPSTQPVSASGAPTTPTYPLSSTETRHDGAVRLTTPPDGASDQNPTFSPHGSHLVFTRFENGYNTGPAGLFLLNLNSGQITH